MNECNGYKIERFDELASTNDYCKEKRAERQNLVVSAKRQTRGRGTKGRSFASDAGGVFLSALTFHETLAAKDAFTIMANSAVAVCETLRAYGVEPVIKWPNDIHVQGKKICGILIENAFSGERVVSSVVGVGLNVANGLPDELSGLAITLSQALGKPFSETEVAAVEEKLVCALTTFRRDVMQAYRAFLGYMNERATLLIGEEKLTVTLRSVDDEGGLLAETEMGEERFAAAEVSLRT